MQKKETKERTIESYLSKYDTYKLALKNCQRHLEYISPTLVGGYEQDGQKSIFFISNDTEKVALDRITSKKALDLMEEIERYKLIVNSIDEAMRELNESQRIFVRSRYFLGRKIYEIKDELNFSEDKAVYRIRRQVLDKFLISLNNLLKLN